MSGMSLVLCEARDGESMAEPPMVLQMSSMMTESRMEREMECCYLKRMVSLLLLGGVEREMGLFYGGGTNQSVRGRL